MQFFRRASAPSSSSLLKLGILAGTFNPPTIAHLHLLEAARNLVDELLCVVPRAFPHKTYHGATLEERLQLLGALNLPPDCSIAVSDSGLLAEIAQECRVTYPGEVRPYFVCGRDAAERIVAWNYGSTRSIEEILQHIELLVAPRGGPYHPPEHLRSRIHQLPLSTGLEDVSSSEIRARIAKGAPWENLVAEAIVSDVRKIYS